MLLHKNAYVQKITNKLEESDVPTMKSGRPTMSSFHPGGGGGGFCVLCKGLGGWRHSPPTSCLF